MEIGATGQLMIWGARFRHYGDVDGLGAAFEEGDPPPGRVYEILAHVRSPGGPLYDVRPLEGGDVGKQYGNYMTKLDDAFPVREESASVRLAPVDSRKFGPYEIGVFLSRSGLARRYWAVSESFRAVGLAPGREYDVLRWLVPRKVVLLDGVVGCYYAGLFDMELDSFGRG